MSTAWTIAYFVLAAGLLLVALLVLGLFRRIAFVLEQAEEQMASASAATAAPSGGIAPGTPVPLATARRPDGSAFSTDELTGRRSIVLFLSATCAPCQALAQELRRRRTRSLPAELVIAVRDEIEHQALGLDGLDVVYQPDFALAKAFETTATPHAFALNQERIVVARSTPNTFRLLRELAETIPVEAEQPHGGPGANGRNFADMKGGERDGIR
jgi:hypothetical protein